MHGQGDFDKKKNDIKPEKKRTRFQWPDGMGTRPPVWTGENNFKGETQKKRGKPDWAKVEGRVRNKRIKR